MKHYPEVKVFEYLVYQTILKYFFLERIKSPIQIDYDSLLFSTLKANFSGGVNWHGFTKTTMLCQSTSWSSNPSLSDFLVQFYNFYCSEPLFSIYTETLRIQWLPAILIALIAWQFFNIGFQITPKCKKYHLHFRIYIQNSTLIYMFLYCR